MIVATMNLARFMPVMPAVTVTTVRPPGMKRATMISPTPRRASRLWAHSRRWIAFGPENRRSIQGRARLPIS